MAITTNFSIFRLDFDIAGYERHLKEEMEEEIKEAAREWLSTVISIVPVWSRASQATFKPLADAVGFVIPTQPLIAAIDRSGLGESTSVGKLELENNKFFFLYETNLEYLGFNEFNAGVVGEGGIISGLKTPTPYNFTGRAADKFKERSVKLPNPLEFLTGKKI